MGWGPGFPIPARKSEGPFAGLFDFLASFFFFFLAAFTIRVLFNNCFRLMAGENTDVLLVVEVSGDEGRQHESFDIPTTMEVNEPNAIIEGSTDISLALEASADEGSQDEKFDIPTTMEVNEPESCNVGVIVNINTPKFRRIFPRYLSPRTGSCHDFCKYGTKHPIERNPASAVLRKGKSVGRDVRDLRRIRVSLAKPNNDTVSPKFSKDYDGINITDLKEDVISSPEIINPSPKKRLPPIKEVEASAVQYSRTKLNLSLSKASSSAGQCSSRTNRNKEVRRSKKQDGYGSSSSSTDSTSRCQEIKISTVGDRKALVPHAVSWTPRNRVKRVAIVDKKIIGRRSLKNQSRLKKIKLDPSNSEVEEKTLYMIEPSTKKETEGPAQNSVHFAELSHSQSSSSTDNSFKHEQEADGTIITPHLLVEKNTRRTRTGTSSKSLSTSPTVFKGFKGLRPKRFDMIQRSETRSAPSSPSSSRCSSEPVHSEKSKVEHKIKARRKTLTDSENGDCQSRKLHFRKGRMVELQAEPITPRRLIFKRVRSLSETQSPKSDSRKRIIQRKEANQNGDEVNEAENSSLRQQDQEFKRKKSFRRQETVDGKLVSSRQKSERIVLKHQDSNEKIEIQKLFNNVIEETATKLAKTRKSKVKALVGAFETVISLQDAKPAATVVG
ncbi:hypothetical protein SDJN02_00750, partial [Cucurbita argyrosperma subsp. argyrosperma]